MGSITARPGAWVWALLAVTLLVTAPSASGKKSLFKMQDARSSGGAPSPGAIASATATCPKRTPRGMPPFRAVSGGFSSDLFVNGRGIVFESQKVGQRSWRASAQSTQGAFNLVVYVNCQLGAPQTKTGTSTITTPAGPLLGPATVASCPSGKALAGGFATPPPFTPTGGANTVIASIPSGPSGWQAQVISNQASSLTSYVYCAKLKRTPVAKSGTGPPVTQLFNSGLAGNPYCGRRTALGGGFTAQGMTASEYLLPTASSRLERSPWSTVTRRIGTGLPGSAGIPVTPITVGLCG